MRANKQRLLTNNTGPLLRLLLISIVASPGSKRKKIPGNHLQLSIFSKKQKIDDTSSPPAIPELSGYKSRCNTAAKAPRHENSLRPAGAALGLMAKTAASRSSGLWVNKLQRTIDRVKIRVKNCAQVSDGHYCFFRPAYLLLHALSKSSSLTRSLPICKPRSLQR